MKFFSRKKAEEIEPKETGRREEHIVTETATPEQPRTAEEIARAWWREQYGTTIPDEVMQWIKSLVRTEAKRQFTAKTILGQQQLDRLKEAKRLAQTKLENTEENLLLLREQQEWLRRFHETNSQLNEERSRLYELNKLCNGMSRDEKELARFETFEAVQGLFQRLQIFEASAGENKRMQSLLTRDLEEATSTYNEEQKRLTQVSETREEAETRMAQAQDTLAMGYHLQGGIEVHQQEEKRIQDALTQLKSDLVAKEKACHERESDLEMLQEEIERHRAGRQSMEMHEMMLEHSEGVLTMLDSLLSIHTQLSESRNQQNEGQRLQTQENDTLGRIFGQYQSIQADINTLNDELQTHRGSIYGLDSFKLQERAMSLKSHRQMLLSAQSLWNRISAGYLLIEDRTQALNALRLHIDHTQTNLEELDKKVAKLRRICKEKEYNLNLSKSQNVIQLRSDLEEGVSCTVCGATHHPYHSDTMLEQSKLISDMRTDYELQAAELRGQEQQLMDLRIDLARSLGEQSAQESLLSTLRRRQMDDVKEWALYSNLDRTFAECSSSTNLEARQQMLRQLIENIGKDAEEAQRELDNFNFHQARINDITERLTQKEQEKSELNVRLNEVNTGCQVMAGRVERLQQESKVINGRFRKLYDEVDALITLPDWYREWKENPEGLKMKIQQMAETWHHLNQRIADEQKDAIEESATLQGERQAIEQLKTYISLLTELHETNKTQEQEKRNNYHRSIGEQDITSIYQEQQLLLNEARSKETRQQCTTTEAHYLMALAQGRQENSMAQGTQLGEKATTERQALDLWIRSFNANHSPVQYVELEQAFSNNTDWNNIREHVRQVRMDTTLCQARVDALRSSLIALQAEGLHLSIREGDESQKEAIIAQREILEARRNETLLQIAQYQATLQAHEQAKERLKQEEEELYNKLNS